MEWCWGFEHWDVCFFFIQLWDHRSFQKLSSSRISGECPISVCMDRFERTWLLFCPKKTPLGVSEFLDVSARAASLVPVIYFIPTVTRSWWRTGMARWTMTSAGWYRFFSHPWSRPQISCVSWKFEQTYTIHYSYNRIFEYIKSRQHRKKRVLLNHQQVVLQNVPRYFGEW